MQGYLEDPRNIVCFFFVKTSYAEVSFPRKELALQNNLFLHQSNLWSKIVQAKI